jgi:hypothetical protein
MYVIRSVSEARASFLMEGASKPRLVYVNERPRSIWAHWGTLEGLPLRHTKHIAYAYAMQARKHNCLKAVAIQCIPMQLENGRKCNA